MRLGWHTAFFASSWALLGAAGTLVSLPGPPVRPITHSGAAAAYVEREDTLLDEVGHLEHAVASAEVAGWRAELHRVAPRERAEWLHLRLGEYELAHNQAPARALQHWRTVEQLAPAASPQFGLAAYNSAMGLFYEGRYRDSAAAFEHLLKARPALRGFSRRRCALFYRDAAACAGYHAERAKLGIAEPQRLDPLCGRLGNHLMVE